MASASSEQTQRPHGALGALRPSSDPGQVAKLLLPMGKALTDPELTSSRTVSLSPDLRFSLPPSPQPTFTYFRADSKVDSFHPLGGRKQQRQPVGTTTHGWGPDDSGSNLGARFQGSC